MQNIGPGCMTRWDLSNGIEVLLPARAVVRFTASFGPALGSTQPPVQRATRAPSAGIEESARDDGHSPPSLLRFRILGTISPLPHMAS